MLNYDSIVNEWMEKVDGKNTRRQLQLLEIMIHLHVGRFNWPTKKEEKRFYNGPNIKKAMCKSV